MKTYQTLMAGAISLLITFSVQADIVEVSIYKFEFIPKIISIKSGDTIVWVNKEKRQYHNVWFEQFDAKQPDYLFPGDRYERTFNQSGEFPYRCGPHPEMKATVIVE
ncbi:plastocyanin/azurin family copper-binding protein [Neptunomonas sp.]|uniref:cupredoxin domain-containing protein n=1 Tax=Neptunomonas sp. TaxID=1971898 RepID=UPI0025FD4AD7|nr:plastocyanin/azurin family copper-binding protein [Neptunomonas sp.]